ncbi:MAG: NIPSNAP family protein [Ignavibacteriae bacterium]|nr:NIPSNAP family protein [Ignavibacteriota bacterium]
MSKSLNRRNFLKISAALAVVAGSKKNIQAINDKISKEQEYYEYRIYKVNDSKNKIKLENYLGKALIPALNRMNIDRIGVFTEIDKPNDFSIHLIIPYSSLELFSEMNTKLLEDKDYINAAEEHFDVPLEDPVFSRVQSNFFKAFAGMPIIELPQQSTENKPRIFELRKYESHTEQKAALKIDMFNSGEIQIMRDTELAPVFYGEALIGSDLPNLTYMLSASDLESHKVHWSNFSAHPEWQRMKKIPKYNDTVSNITKIFLKPTDYSQI